MNRQTGQAFVIALMIILMFGAVYLGICTYAVLRVTEIPPGPSIEPKPSEFGLAYEDVHFPARNDGLEVAGWFIPKEESQCAVILVHGRYENRASAMSGQFPKLAAALYEAGYAVLMIDLRGHGESAPARFDFGIKAQNDVLGAVDWLIETDISLARSERWVYRLAGEQSILRPRKTRRLALSWSTAPMRIFR